MMSVNPTRGSGGGWWPVGVRYSRVAGSPLNAEPHEGQKPSPGAFGSPQSIQAICSARSPSCRGVPQMRQDQSPSSFSY